MQLQMALPQIMVQAQELVKAADSIKLGKPIGDGVGPMVASKFIGDAPKESIAKDTVMVKTTLKGRQLYIVKAEGPMGYVGAAWSCHPEDCGATEHLPEGDNHGRRRGKARGGGHRRGI